VHLPDIIVATVSKALAERVNGTRYSDIVNQARSWKCYKVGRANGGRSGVVNFPARSMDRPGAFLRVDAWWESVLAEYPRWYCFATICPSVLPSSYHVFHTPLSSLVDTATVGFVSSTRLFYRRHITSFTFSQRLTCCDTWLVCALFSVNDIVNLTHRHTK